VDSYPSASPGQTSSQWVVGSTSEFSGTPLPTRGTTIDLRPEAPPGGQKRRAVRGSTGQGDKAFHGIIHLAGLAVLAIMGSVGLFLSLRALQAIKAIGPAKFLTTQAWQPDSHHFGIAAVLTGTILIAMVAVTISIPLSLGTSLFISEVVPNRVKQTLVSIVDLMAAVPSVVYGLWGLKFLQGHVVGVARFISTWLGWIPIFKVNGADPRNPLQSASVFTASTFVAGIVVALMIVPIQTSIMREVFSRTPAGEREGAYALGAARWGMIRSVVLPFGRGGIIGGTMLGLGRALGETIAVYLIISPLFHINIHILQTGANSVSSLIALHYGDASNFGMSALMAAGLALFTLTLIVNFTASAIVARSRSGAESD
jgi:phosphate transport system permease protein